MVRGKFTFCSLGFIRVRAKITYVRIRVRKLITNNDAKSVGNIGVRSIKRACEVRRWRSGRDFGKSEPPNTECHIVTVRVRC